VNHMWTLSALQMHPCALILADEDATLELQVKTVKVKISITNPDSFVLTNCISTSKALNKCHKLSTLSRAC